MDAVMRLGLEETSFFVIDIVRKITSVLLIDF